jgi:hypothetical protein
MEDGIENCHEWSLQAANQCCYFLDWLKIQDDHQRGT